MRRLIIYFKFGEARLGHFTRATAIVIVAISLRILLFPEGTSRYVTAFLYDTVRSIDDDDIVECCISCGRNIAIVAANVADGVVYLHRITDIKRGCALLNGDNRAADSKVVVIIASTECQCNKGYKKQFFHTIARGIGVVNRRCRTHEVPC